MSEDYSQLNDDSSEESRCDNKKCLHNIGYSITFTLWIGVSYSLGILANWWLSGNSPYHMSISDYIASLLFGVIAGMMIVGIFISIRENIYIMMKWCQHRLLTVDDINEEDVRGGIV